MVISRPEREMRDCPTRSDSTLLVEHNGGFDDEPPSRPARDSTNIAHAASRTDACTI